jgi:pyruvate kinase
MRKTKIICTLGPASHDLEQIGGLLDAGMNAARLNFSHGKHDYHAETIRRVREAAAQRNRMIPIIADLQGPKIRTGQFEGGLPVHLEAGASVRLTNKPVIGNSELVPLDYSTLAEDVKPGERVMLSDGALELRVLDISGQDVICEVVTGGLLGERKGVNVPSATLKLPSITEKDKEDLCFSLKQGVDYIALSFVRSAADVHRLRELIRSEDSDTQIIAKLEKPQALEALDSILEAADGVMVARGDLGVELSPWIVPVEQKRIIAHAARARKPVITATQMLESMISSPSPTRAEASDVANAVFDGSDALMLSGETAVGKYPVKCVEMMKRIIETAEATPEETHLPQITFQKRGPGLSDAVAHSATQLAEDLNAKYIVVYTESGYTARLISKHRPHCSILALSRHTRVCQRMKLLRGVRAKQIEQVDDIDHLVAVVDAMFRKLKWLKEGDLICVIAGTPFQVAGKTDLIKLHRIGEETSTGRRLRMS